MSSPASMLLCGCAATAMHSGAHDGLPGGHPSCIVHDCCAVAVAPDFGSRRARCDYYGKPPHKSECNYDCDRAGECRCERPSSLNLPYFKHLGPDSMEAAEKCACGYFRRAHWPRWRITLRLDREWFKVGRHFQDTASETYAPDLAAAAAWTLAEMERFGRLGLGDQATHVYGVELIAPPVQVPNKLKCRTFTPHGPWEHDAFYCGCHGWD